MLGNPIPFLSPGVSKLYLWDQIYCTPAFVNKVLLETQPCLFVHVFSLPALELVLKSWDRDHLFSKAETIYSRAIHGKFCWSMYQAIRPFHGSQETETKKQLDYIWLTVTEGEGEVEAGNCGCCGVNMKCERWHGRWADDKEKHGGASLGTSGWVGTEGSGAGGQDCE